MGVINAANLAEFALLSGVIEVTPGPNMTYLAVIAATEGRRRGYAAVLGVCLGLAVIGLAAAFGLAVVISGNPAVYQALKWAGVAYLLWLAWDGWRGADEAVQYAEAGSSVAKFFRRGLITNLLNPKAALFYVSVLPGFVDGSGAVQGSILAQTLVLTGIYVAIATAIHAGIVTAAGAAERLLEDPVRQKLVRRGLAVVLVGVAVWFALG